LVAPALSEHSTQYFIARDGTDFGGVPRAMNLTILHINDHHSHLVERTTELDVPGVGAVEMHTGGYPRIVKALANMKAEAMGMGDAVLKLHAGDAITGTSYYSLFSGEADAALMQHACFDAFELGNHEFDDGDANLASFIDMLHDSTTCPDTKVLAANVVPGPTSPLVGKVDKSAVFSLNGERVGVVGIDIAAKTMLSSRPSPGTMLTDEQAAAQAEIDVLIAHGINKIILLMTMPSMILDWLPP